MQPVERADIGCDERNWKIDETIVAERKREMENWISCMCTFLFRYVGFSKMGMKMHSKTWKYYYKYDVQVGSNALPYIRIEIDARLTPEKV